MSIFELDSDVGMMDRHDPKQIRARQFARVRKGFDPEQVRVFLDEVATSMEQLQSELRFSQEEAEAASRRAGPDPYTQLGSHVAELVRGAEEHAVRVRREAKEEGDRQVAQAKEQSEQATQEAQAEAKRVRAEASAEADRVTEKAETEAQRLRMEAQAESSRLHEEARTALERAKADAEAMVSELTGERDRLLGDIGSARESLSMALARLDEVFGSIGHGGGEKNPLGATPSAQSEEGAATEAPLAGPPPPPAPAFPTEDSEAQQTHEVPTGLPPLPDLWEFTAELDKARFGDRGSEAEHGAQTEGPSEPESEGDQGLDPKDIDIQIPDIPLVEDRGNQDSS